MRVRRHIRHRIRRHGRGAVFSARDFADLGTRASVDQALSRLARAGEIRRVDRGVYDLPVISSRVGPRSPDPDRVAAAVARSHGWRLQRTGAVAAHALGLSDQVPARAIYYTDGPNRTLDAGNRKIVLRHGGPRTLLGAGTITGDVYQALRFLGRDAIDDRVVDHLKRRLSIKDKQRLRRDLVAYPAWVQGVMRRVNE